MTKEERAIVEELKKSVPIVNEIEHDCDVREAYRKTTLTMLHMLKNHEVDAVVYDRVKRIREKLMEILKNYLCGKVHTSATQMENLLKWKLGNQTLLHCAVRKQKPATLYRGRISDVPLDSVADFYHIPFSKRYLIGNQRYSLSGIPCLYLASSIACVRCELDEPSVSTLSLCAFQQKEELAFFDVSVGYDEMMEQELPLDTFLYTLPLKIACSMKVEDNQTGTFKTNYVIPQLISATLYNMAKKKKKQDPDAIKAICFSSIKGAHLSYEERMNYVFLPDYTSKKEVDEALIKKFSLHIVPIEEQESSKRKEAVHG